MSADPNTPEGVAELLLQAAGQLFESIRLVNATRPAEEAAAYNRAVRHILCQIFGKILCPITAINPIEPSVSDSTGGKREPSIGDIGTAQQISETMFDVSRRLSESLESTRNLVPNEVFRGYALAVGGILADIMYNVLNPLFATYPSVEPKGWK